MKPAEWCLLSVQEIRVPPQKYIQIRFQVRSDHFAWLLMLLLLLGTPQSRRCEFIAFKYLLIVFRELLKHQGGQRAPIAKASTEYFFNDIIRCSYIIVLWPETDVSESRRVTTFGSLSLHGSSIDSWMNAFHQKFPVMEPWSWIMVHDAYEICVTLSHCRTSVKLAMRKFPANTNDWVRASKILSRRFHAADLPCVFYVVQQQERIYLYAASSWSWTHVLWVFCMGQAVTARCYFTEKKDLSVNYSSFGIPTVNLWRPTPSINRELRIFVRSDSRPYWHQEIDCYAQLIGDIAVRVSALL